MRKITIKLVNILAKTLFITFFLIAFVSCGGPSPYNSNDLSKISDPMVEVVRKACESIGSVDSDGDGFCDQFELEDKDLAKVNAVNDPNVPNYIDAHSSKEMLLTSKSAKWPYWVGAMMGLGVVGLIYHELKSEVGVAGKKPEKATEDYYYVDDPDMKDPVTPSVTFTPIPTQINDNENIVTHTQTKDGATINITAGRLKGKNSRIVVKGIDKTYSLVASDFNMRFNDNFTVNGIKFGKEARLCFIQKIYLIKYADGSSPLTVKKIIAGKNLDTNLFEYQIEAGIQIIQPAVAEEKSKKAKSKADVDKLCEGDSEQGAFVILQNNQNRDAYHVYGLPSLPFAYYIDQKKPAQASAFGRIELAALLSETPTFQFINSKTSALDLYGSNQSSSETNAEYLKGFSEYMQDLLANPDPLKIQIPGKSPLLRCGTQPENLNGKPQDIAAYHQCLARNLLGWVNNASGTAQGKKLFQGS